MQKMIVNQPDDCLRQPEKLWESIFNSITDRISLQDCDCCIVNCNKAYAGALGKSPAEIIGKKCYELMHGTSEPIASCPHCSTITNGKTACFQVNDPATNKFYEVATTPWKNEWGALEGTIHITKDVSDRVHAEIELEKAIERANDLAVKAELANIAKSHFLATMSHEIRTPLNGIVGMTDLLLDTALSAEQRNFVNIISTSGESLLSIIEDVLDYSKIEAGKMRLEKRPFDYRKIVRETIDILSEKAREKNLALSARIDDALPATVVGDDARIRQILINLVNNAIKFTDRGSVTIEVKSVSVSKNSVELTTSVIDTGIGIDEEGKTRLFKLFSQIDNSKERKYGGTGLGLAICKKIVELFSGSIGVDSVPGKGSNFHFTVKLDRADAKSAAATALKTPALSSNENADIFGNPLKSFKVLVAEDNAINQLVTRKTLESIGLYVDCVSTGKEAVESLRTTNYHCLFLDIHMPVMDGITAATMIRQASPDTLDSKIPIIAMTASTEKTELEACDTAGMDLVLTKPVRREKIIGAIKTVMNKKSPGESAKIPGNGKVILNTTDLLLTLDNDQKLLDEILIRFSIDMGGLIATMKICVASAKMAEAKRIAHTIKGASLNIGAQDMADLTIAFESACRNNTTQPGIIMEKLEQSFLAVEQTIGRQLAAG
ncbi:MAG: ATP-binding protein [Chitinivibrionales bacterium]